MAVDTRILLTPQAMAEVDRRTIAAGSSGATLMGRAGVAIARLCLSLMGVGHIRIFCGPGNNGGDGYVAAKYLYDAGWTVDLWTLVEPAKLKGDAAWAEAYCPLVPRKLSELSGALEKTDIFLDALFGAGLSKPLSGDISDMISAALDACDISIAADLPSGVSGATGEDMSGLYTAWPNEYCFDHSVTFGAHKFGHVLEPGRSVCGTVWLADIGLQGEGLQSGASGTLNVALPIKEHTGLSPKARDHKYHRGHVGVVCGSHAKQGAGHLAAKAALASGAGLVTLLDREPGVAGGLPSAIMHAPWPSPSDLAALIAEKKISALVIGPGLGLDEAASALLDAALGANVRLVLDADALTLIARHEWQSRLMSNMVITPHEGEFTRLFPGLSGPKISRFDHARVQTGCILCFKGSDTLIGKGGEGDVCVSVGAPPTLATAGSGDVLAGLVAGVWPPGVYGEEAARIAVRLHTLAAQYVGEGLYADKLIQSIGEAIAYYKTEVK